jgi:hypothetical protein
MENQQQSTNEIKNSQKKEASTKATIIAIVAVAIVIAIVGDKHGLTTTSNNNQQAVQEVKSKNDLEEIKQKQQKAVGDIYELSKKSLKRSMENMTVLSKYKRVPRTAEIYSAFKEDESLFMKLSVQFSNMKDLADEDYMKDYKDDIEKTLDALATASVIQQIYDKNMADYINTGNLESQRKANEEMKKNPALIMMQATNQIIAVAGKAGMDSESMRKEIGVMLEEIKKLE